MFLTDCIIYIRCFWGGNAIEHYLIYKGCKLYIVLQVWYWRENAIVHVAVEFISASASLYMWWYTALVKQE